ncbi:MAG TPA: ABC transporter ATP-binding protein [Pseudogracilibacillus sp.]|nr:ABC transporter ATP-binding protein [Pseudogracilibacillus sp.]
MAILRLENVSHHYFTPTGYTKALDDISFTVEKGEFISLIGPSSCGKSTILSLIARLMKQTDGKITIGEQNVSKEQTEVGYMLQQDYLFPWKTILNNVLLGPKIQKQVKAPTIDRARKLLADVNLSDTIDQYPTELSGGMRQRIALVRTLMTDPEILLFDEPFSALDYVTKLQLENVVAKLMKTYKKTAILVTHDLAEAISMSDRILLMGAHPGTIKKEFIIPEELRSIEPFYVRRHDLYQPLFDAVWHEFRTDSSRKGGVVEDEGNHR